ncbi:MAG: hypothetical protein C0594_14430 [Marinilabiliales bacterium]|nr:MAG: hypothetical protein C0594_14430 [Marinilabiliales bacterium]
MIYRLPVIFYIDDTRIEVFMNNDIAELNDMFIAVMDYMKSDSYSAKSMANYGKYVESAHDLYKLLIMPCEKWIQGKSITIVPDNILCYLPFEVLLTRDVKNLKNSFKSLPYLIKEYPISYAYSIRLLDMVNPKQGGKARMLAMAPEFKGDESLNFISENIYRSNNLSPLKYNVEEIVNISKYFKGTYLKGKQANESKFYELAENNDIIHIASHTIIDDNIPMRSKIVLSKDSLDEDGYLNTYEIYQTKLNADLVVLSGCQTGYGKYFKGEGISSLTNGFLYAGCPSIVATLWDASDKSAMRLMSYFYKNLSLGQDKDIALRNAKLEYLEKCPPYKASPHYWAGFIMIGHTNPVVPPDTG